MESMKALSIKQPWAWLICAGYKDIENRTWKIGRNSQHGPYSSYHQANFTINIPERIYVHTGKGRDIEAINSILNYQWDWIPDDAMDAVIDFEINDRWILGCIIGEVDITGCVTESDSPWFSGPYGFTLANPVLYDDPVPYPGRLGFFTPEISEKVK